MIDFHVDKGTYVKHPLTANKVLEHLIVALIPIILFSIYKNGIIPYINDKVGIYGLLLPIIIIFISILTGSVSEALYYKLVLKDKRKIKEILFNLESIMPGLLMALIIPITTPLSIVVLGSFLGTVVGKMLFGGYNKHKLNPSLLGSLAVMVILTMTMTNNYSNPYELGQMQTNSPLINAMSLDNIGSYNEIIKPFGHLRDFFIGLIPGSLGATSVLLSILAFVYLLFNKIIKWKITITYLLTVFVMTFVIGNYNGLGLWYPLFHIMSGGLVFISVFLATDLLTTPTTPIAQLLFGLYIGIITVLLRFLNIEVEGASIAILTMNAMVVFIDYIGAKARYSFKKSILLFMVAWFLLMTISTYLAISL